MFGQLGDGTSTSRPEPRKAGKLALEVAGIAAGKSHTCAFNTSGTAHCWGMNMAGELGIGSSREMSSSENVFTDRGEKITGIFPGDGRTCAVLASGEGLCWGSSMYGLTGDGREPKNSNAPVKVKWIGKKAASFAVGRDHACALLTDGSVRCWGSIAGVDSTEAVEVEGLADVVQIVAGGFHTCALGKDGSVRCWGDNGSGQLGDGTTTERKGPVEVKL
jgi:alpha-tubulin suppressor-like RCC1 family protein